MKIRSWIELDCELASNIANLGTGPVKDQIFSNYSQNMLYAKIPPMPNLHSAITNLGKTVTQIIHFSNGNKRTFSGIITESIKQGEFTKMMLKDGRMLMINTANVDCIEVFDETIDKQMS